MLRVALGGIRECCDFWSWVQLRSRRRRLYLAAIVFLGDCALLSRSVVCVCVYGCVRDEMHVFDKRRGLWLQGIEIVLVCVVCQRGRFC